MSGAYNGQKPTMPVMSGIRATIPTTVPAVPLRTSIPAAARMMPNVRKYAQNHFLEIPGQEMEGDGLVETWYDDIKSWQASRDAIMKMPELKKDGMNFARMAPANFFWVTEEHVILDNTGKKK